MARFCPTCAGLTEFGEPGEPCPACEYERAAVGGESQPVAGAEVYEDDGGDDDPYTEHGGEG